MTNRATVNGQPAARGAPSTLPQLAANDGLPPPSTWKIGLINRHGKYLTAETFGFTINAAGTSLRRKQLWTVEHDAVDDDTVYFRSHLGRYLAGDRKVYVTVTSFHLLTPYCYNLLRFHLIDWTAIRPPFDSHSTAPFDRATIDRLSTL